MRIRQVFGVGLLAAALCLAWNGKAQAAPIPEEELTIADGVYAEDLSLAGMTEEEAQEAITEYMNELGQKVLTVDVNGNTAQATLEELGLSWVNNTVVQDAALLGRGGNVISRYKELEGLKYNEVVFDLEVAVDEEKLNQFITEKIEAFNIEPQNASLTRKGGKFVVTESKTGIKVNVEATKQSVLEALKEPWNGELSAVATAEIAEPAHTSEALSEIKSNLGTCTTVISNMSDTARYTNVVIAARKVNGTILYPGEEMSFSTTLGPRNAANGWQKAGEFTEGGSTQDYGGGICQAATTFYGACLEAEVKVTERWNHSREVWYTEFSKDAAISGSSKDLKIRNDFDFPIYFEAYVSGNTMTYTIYGKETRPSNRKVVYVSKVLSMTDPVRQESATATSTLGPYRKIKSTLTKNVYVNGKLVESTLLHTDNYKPLWIVPAGTGSTEEPSTGAAGEPTTKPGTTEAPETEAPETEAPPTAANPTENPTPSPEPSAEAPVPAEGEGN